MKENKTLPPMEEATTLCHVKEVENASLEDMTENNTFQFYKGKIYKLFHFTGIHNEAYDNGYEQIAEIDGFRYSIIRILQVN